MIKAQNQMFKQRLTKPVRNTCFFPTCNTEAAINIQKWYTYLHIALLLSEAQLITVFLHLYTSINPVTLLTGIKGHIAEKWVPRTQPDNRGIDNPIQTVWISWKHCTVRSKTHKTPDVGNVTRQCQPSLVENHIKKLWMSRKLLKQVLMNKTVYFLFI